MQKNGDGLAGLGGGILKSDNRSLGDTKIRKNVQEKMEQRAKQFEEDTGNIIVMIKGSKIKENIWIFEDRGIRVKPYIPPVKQCFKCFKFGHIKM